jgi:hypothetical protein
MRRSIIKKKAIPDGTSVAGKIFNKVVRNRIPVESGRLMFLGVNPPARPEMRSNPSRQGFGRKIHTQFPLPVIFEILEMTLQVCGGL